MYDYSKLRGRIVEKCGSQACFAERCGISKVQISRLLNGQAEFSQKQIETFIEHLDIDRREITKFFYTLQ